MSTPVELFENRMALAPFASSLFSLASTLLPADYEGFANGANGLLTLTDQNKTGIRIMHETFEYKFRKHTPAFITASIIQRTIAGSVVSLAQDRLAEGKLSEFIFWYDYSFGVNNVNGVLQRIIISGDGLSADSFGVDTVHLAKNNPFFTSADDDLDLYLASQDEINRIRKMVRNDPSGIAAINYLHGSLLDAIYKPVPTGDLFVPQWVELGADEALAIYERLYPKVVTAINEK